MKFLHNIHILNKMKQEQRLPCFDNLQWVKCLTIWQIWICLNFNHWGSNLNSFGGKLTNSQITHVTKHCNQNFKLMGKETEPNLFQLTDKFQFPKKKLWELQYYPINKFILKGRTRQKNTKEINYLMRSLHEFSKYLTFNIIRPTIPSQSTTLQLKNW